MSAQHGAGCVGLVLENGMGSEAGSNDVLDDLVTPEEIARRISQSSGVHMTARTVWEKARRVGVAKKIGRSPLISARDIPFLLQEETKQRQRALLEEASAAARQTNLLRTLRRNRKQRAKKNA